MEKWYILYESLYYVSNYIEKINYTPRTMIWDEKHDEEKREWELLQTNGEDA